MSDGAKLYYEVTGSGPPLVLIPGIGAALKVWGPFPKALGSYFRTIAFDPRGLGQSTLPADGQPEDLRLERMALDICELIEAAGAPRAHVMGLSLGGIVGQYLASEHPHAVDRLVLVATAGSLNPWTRRVVELYEILLSRLSPEEYVKAVIPLITSPPYYRAEPKRVADLEKRLLFKPETLPVIRAQITALASLDRAAPKIKVPTLIISGTMDLLTPPFCADEIHKNIEGSKLVRLEGGHSCLMERTEEGLVSILSFLRHKDSPGERDGRS